MNMAPDIDILLVEDNPADVDLTLLAFKEARLKNKISVVSDGVEAMAFLRQQGQYANVTRPDMVLLDLNMPRKDGREVLQEIKNDPVLHTIPVIILTSSDNEMDILKSYELYANCYIKKPVNFENLMEVVKKTGGFWLNVVLFPQRKSINKDN